MSDEDVFKSLVVALLVAFGVVGVYILLAPPDLPGAAVRYYEWRQGNIAGETEILVQRVSLFVFLVMLFSVVGLLFFFSIARYALVLCVFFMAIRDYFVTVPMLLTGFELFIDTVISVLIGAITAMSFSGSVARKFKE